MSIIGHNWKEISPKPLRSTLKNTRTWTSRLNTTSIWMQIQQITLWGNPRISKGLPSFSLFMVKKVRRISSHMELCLARRSKVCSYRKDLFSKRRKITRWKISDRIWSSWLCSKSNWLTPRRIERNSILRIRFRISKKKRICKNPRIECSKRKNF